MVSIIISFYLFIYKIKSCILFERKKMCSVSKQRKKSMTIFLNKKLFIAFIIEIKAVNILLINIRKHFNEITLHKNGSFKSTKGTQISPKFPYF